MEPECRSRVVLLGASNLTRGISTVVRVAQNNLPGPLEFLIACGHGRSYGQDSTVLARTLPGIRPSGLWSALESAPSRPTWALITDVGNDLLYGVPPEQVADWVDQCLARLRAVDARIVITGPPMESLARLSRWRFTLLSRACFPFHNVRFETLRESVAKLDAALRQLAAKHQATWVAPQVEWYGIDPIHIRMRVWNAAWEKVFFSWRETDLPPNQATSGALAQWLFLKRLRPEYRRIAGFARRTTQPSGIMSNGSRVSMY